MADWVSTRRLSKACEMLKGYVDRKTSRILFSLEVDSAGNLYAVFPDGAEIPEFEYEASTGNLYLIID